MRKICLIALSILCFILLVSCKGDSNDPAIVFSENGVVTKEIATETAGTLTVPSPAGTRARYCVGWHCKNGEKTVFLPVGASYTYAVGESSSFTPVYFHFTTSPDALLDTAVEGWGIAFSTDIERADWTKLAAIAEGVSCGTLIASTADATLAGALTHEALAKVQKTPAADIPSAAWQAESETALTFGATLGNIADSDLTTPYTAVGYVKITYTNGESAYVYAAYGESGAPTCTLISFPEVVKERLSFTTLSSASLDLNENGGGITFSSTIDRKDWELLTRLAKSITRGTLIYPAAGLGELGGSLTHASLKAAEKTAIDIPSTTWLPGTDQTLYFGATLSNFLSYHRNIEFTAVGYVKIVYSDDTVTYVYAAREGTAAPKHSIFTLAKAALNDLSNEMTDLYPHPVGDKFSPYNEEARAKLDELSVSRVDVLINTTSAPGWHLLDPAYAGLFNSRVVTQDDTDPAAAAEWNDILRNALRDIDYYGGGALIITAADATPLNAENITKVVLKNGAEEEPDFTEYIFYKGALIVPYKVFSENH